jgi:YegS/Rv2252/BmrU family lipid kinase
LSIAIIVNPISGGVRHDAARRRAELASTLLAASGEEGEVFVTERRGHARELAASAVARGARLVVAWGGDGTVNEVASALAFGPTSLAIVPSGSGNGLARALGIGPRPERAMRNALAATPRPIDAGELGGRLFFSIAGVGFDAHVASCFDRESAGRRGLSGYLLIVARELVSYKPSTYRVGGGDAPPLHALLVTLANSSQFGNGARIAPDARVDDGKLDLVVFEEISRLRTVCGMPRLFTGGIARQVGVSIRQIERTTIESDQPMIFHVDGEPVQGGTRLDARVHRGALRVSVV